MLKSGLSILDKPQVYTDQKDFIINISDNLISSHPIANAAFFLEIKQWFPKPDKRRLRYDLNDQHGSRLYRMQNKPWGRVAGR